MANLGYVQVTRRCNQKCLFCSNPEIQVDIDPSEGRRLMEGLVRAGYDGVIFTGGEPTLSPHLPDLVSMALGMGLPPRIVTNGQLLGTDPDLLDRLVAAGLSHVHVSLYSSRPEVVAELTCKPDSLESATRALERLGALEGRVSVDVNTVISHRNADHLDEHVRSVVERFPFVRHFVFNNLDAHMNRVSDNPWTVPALWELELNLFRALRFLEASGRTFRVERVPLCYMVEFAHASTETRKIIKSEERTTHFLDDKGSVRQTGFLHDKAECCSVCMLDPVCAGLDGVGEGFHLEELHPVFVPAAEVVGRVLGRPASSIPGSMIVEIAARQGAVPRRKR